MVVRQDEICPEQAVGSVAQVVIQHHTPLIRKLKDVDMWLQHNKINNLRIAVNKINSIVIKQGETFSYWRLIGKPTRRKGYLEGMVLFYGGYHPGIGGGLSPLAAEPLAATTIWTNRYIMVQDYQLHVYLTEEHLAGEWRAVRHNILHRRVYKLDHGESPDDEYITENHAIMMYQPFLSDGT